jgi:hypothetical protein
MILTALFAPAVWYVVIDDTERISTRAPGSLIPHNHTAKPNRPRFLRGQGWLCRWSSGTGGSARCR